MNKDKKPLPKRWITCPIEEEYFGEERKAKKHEKKRVIAKDRSKYKKTDLDQRKKHVEQEPKSGTEEFLRGRVLSINPEGIIVDWEGKSILCTLRGVLKKDKTLHKNLVTIGDFVLFELQSDNNGVIASIEERRTVLSRADNLSRRKEQLIAANIDQVIITASVITPSLKTSLIDRYIIAARKGGMTPVIVINKVDLLDDPEFDEAVREQEKAILEETVKAYAALDIPLIVMSAEKGVGLDALETVMRGKASVFSGQSGVGKSSLINAVTGTDLRTGKIVLKTRKGAHTTTTAQLVPLSHGGWCIDTPGIKSFGVWNLKRDEIEAYFSEIHECGRKCYFPDCSHTHEKGCAVIEAVENETISPLRYLSYVTLIETINEEHVRR